MHDDSTPTRLLIDQRRRSKRVQLLQAPLDLVHLVHQVPDILRHVPHSSLPNLLSTSRSLRSQIHDYTSSIDICQEEDIHLLVSRRWPSLRTVRLAGSISAANMQPLCQNSWQTLTSLDLDHVRLDLSCIQLLATGSWPSLQSLHLQHTNLYGDRMAALQKGKWPKLKSLDLWNCNMNTASIAHLTAAQLPQLESLDLGYNHLTAASIEQVSKGRWPQLRTLSMLDVFCNQVEDIDGHINPVTDANGDHIGELDPAFMLHLSSAEWPNMKELNLHNNHLNAANLKLLAGIRWPMLKSLMLGGQTLTAEGCALLSQAQRPLLKHLEIGATEIDTGMARLVSADWSRLKALDLSRNDLDSPTCRQLGKGQWPQLERLCLHGCKIEISGMEDLVKGDWPMLKVLDLACWDMSSFDFSRLLESKWFRLECVELAYGELSGYMVELLSPKNKARLKMEDNVIANASLIADGRWPRLQMLNFCQAANDATWFHDWGKVDPNSFDYRSQHELDY